jgi:hypothetical protein
MKEVAARWNRSESWMSKVVNDEERELYWEDAFKAPFKNTRKMKTESPVLNVKILYPSVPCFA